MSMTRVLWALALCAGALGACADCQQSSSQAGTDARPRGDARAAADAAPAVDAARHDAPGPVDAGGTTDAAAGTDIASGADAATGSDVVTSDATASDATAGEDAATQPPLPDDLEVEGGGNLFRLDTAEAEVTQVLRGAPAGASLDAPLCGEQGKRAHLLTPGAGASALELAGCGWNLPATGSFAADGKALLCFNRLEGAEYPGGGMPHPSAGMPLICRAFADGQLGDDMVVADDAPAWLLDVSREEAEGRWLVRWFRNPSGWLVGPQRAGDAILGRHFDGDAWSAPFATAAP